MEEIGQTLRETRERLGLTLEDVERAIRIRCHHLESIERGDLDSLPSPVQARGFLRNYADFLGQDPEAILLRYAESSKSRRSRVKTTFGEAKTRPTVQVRSRRPRWLTTDVFVAAAVSAAILAVLVWGVGRVVAALSQGREVEQASSEFFIPTFTASPTPVPPASTATPEPFTDGGAGVAPTPTLAFPAGPANVVDLRLIAEKRAWVRVVVDGQEAFHGRLAPGEVLEYQGQDVIEVVTGNGAGVHVYYKGQDQGLLGGLNEVVIRLWTLTGVITPTPTQTPTPTATPRGTEAPSLGT